MRYLRTQFGLFLRFILQCNLGQVTSIVVSREPGELQYPHIDEEIADMVLFIPVGVQVMAEKSLCAQELAA